MLIETILPEEVILEIFSETENSDLRNFLSISDEWRNLLIKNAKVMRKLPLILMHDTWKEKLEFVKNYGKFIRDVQFIGTCIKSFDEILNILETIPNVEKLSFIDLKFSDEIVNEENLEGENVEEEKPCRKLSLRYLTELSISDNNSIGMINFVKTQIISKLTSFKCEINHFDHLKDIEIFLKENAQLQSLELSSQSDLIIYPSDEVLDEFMFRLKKLTIDMPILRFNDQLLKFIKSQQNLKELNLMGIYADFRYHHLMFTEMPSIRKISLNVEALATTESLRALKITQPNKNLVEVSLLGGNLHLNIFDAILKKIPLIRELYIENLTSFYLSDKIHSTLNHCEVLTIDRVNCEFLRFIDMKQLCKVHLNEIIENHSGANYEMNLQNFSKLSGICDKDEITKEALES